MGNKLLTIAVPAYNMEKLLNRCIDSLLVPSILDCLEILIINDGSKDATLKIAKEYERSYPQSIRAIDKPNGGWGSAINLAMKEATGKYFKILDSDDWFNSQAFSEFIAKLKLTEADILATSYSKAYDGKEPIHEAFKDEQCGRILKLSDVLKDNDWTAPAPMASVCYRRELLDGLVVSDRYYADIQFILLPLMRVTTIQYENLDLYQYYLTGNEHSTSIKGYIAHADDFKNMMLKFVRVYEEKKNSFPTEDVKKLFENEASKHVAFSYYLLLSPSFLGCENNSKERLAQLENELKSVSPFMYAMGDKAKKKGLPYIWIWRKTGINVLKLRTWISSLVPGRQG